MIPSNIANHLKRTLQQLYYFLFAPDTFEAQTLAQPGFLTAIEERTTNKDLFWQLAPWIFAGGLIVHSIIASVAFCFDSYFKFGLSYAGLAIGSGFGAFTSLRASVLTRLACTWAAGITIGFAVGEGLALNDRFDGRFDIFHGEQLLNGILASALMATFAFGAARALSGSRHINLTFVLLVQAACSLFVVVLFQQSIRGEALPVVVTVMIASTVLSLIGFFAAQIVTLFVLGLASMPIDIPISVLAYRSERRGRETTWHPVMFNSRSLVPMPCAQKWLLLRLRRNRVRGEQELLKVVFGTSQSRAGLAVFVQLSLEALSVQSLEDIIQLPKSFTWLPDFSDLQKGYSEFDTKPKLPEQLITAETYLRRSAQFVAQFSVSQHSQRKVQALKAALTEVNRLKSKLHALSDPLTKKLHEVALRWENILDKQVQRFVVEPEGQPGISNPFVAGNLVPSEHVTRKNVIESIQRELLDPTHKPMLLLFGPHRSGKSSFLRQLPKILGPDFSVAVLNYQTKALRENAATALASLSEAIRDSLAERRIIVESPEASKGQNQLYAVFHSWITRVGKTLPPDMRVLICFDEFEGLNDALADGWGAGFLDVLRDLPQRCHWIVLMFVGSHTLTELGPAWADRFVGMRRVNMGFLLPEEARALLLQPNDGFQLTYAPYAVDAIMTVTNCQPYLLQVLAFDLVQYLNTQRRKQATIEDVEHVITRSLESGAAYFDDIWREAGQSGREILQSAAWGRPQPLLPEPQRWLREHFIISETGAILVPLMERWVKSNTSNRV